MRRGISLFVMLFALMIGVCYSPYAPEAITGPMGLKTSAQASQWDFGDATAPYPTTLAANGARHINIQSEWWGTVPPAGACANNTSAEPEARIVDFDNDDGLCGWWYNPAAGNQAFAQFLVSVAPTAQPGDRYLNALIDLNEDGDWQDEGEWAISNFAMPLPPGACNFPVTMALGELPSNFPFCTWLRFTITREPIQVTAGAQWAGAGEFASGETEDYRLCWDPSFPPGEGGDAPGSRCPVLAFRLTCKPNSPGILEGQSQVFTLTSTGNVRPNRIKVRSTVVGPCDPNGVWDYPAGTTLETTPPASIIPLPANPVTGRGRPNFESVDIFPNGCNHFPPAPPLPSHASSKYLASYFNLFPGLGPVGAAASADTCKCDVYHPAPLSAALFGIKGTATDENGLPIGGASIRAINADGIVVDTAKTKAGGKYKTGPNLPPGAYTIACEKEGFLSEMQMVSIENGNRKANFILRRPAQIEGAVSLDSFFDVFAMVEITHSDGTLIFKEPTDPRGRYNTDQTLAPGKYKVKATSLGYFPEETSVEIKGGDRAEINFSLIRRPADFYVGCTPSVLRSVPGGSVTSRCEAIPINGFNGFVGPFSAVDLPPGVAATFSPEFLVPPGVLARSTLTLKVGEGVAPGSYLFKVGATSGSLARFVDAQLIVEPRRPDPDFVIACDPASLTVMQGQSGQSSCRVTSIDGFAGQVLLACAGLPPGVKCGFQPGAVTPPTNGSALSTLTVSVDSNAQPGTYSFQVTSANTDVTRAFNMQLTVLARPAEPSFTVAGNPSSITAPPGGLGQSLCTVTSQNGFNRGVMLSCEGLPDGVTFEFQHNPVTPPPNGQANSIMVLRVPPGARLGTYPFVLQGLTIDGSPPLSVTNAMQLVIAR